MKKYRNLLYVLFFCLCTILFSSCGKDKTSNVSDKGTPRDHTPVVLVPEASNNQTFQANNIIVDVSNISEGYFMVKYTGDVPKVRVQIIAPDGSKIQPLLSIDGNYKAFPLASGNGTYQIKVLENTSGDSYAVLLSETLDVTLADEFRPFLYPNQYVDFTSQTSAVAKSSELSTDTYSDLEVIENIYKYVIENITYDEEKALAVVDGYLPVVDETLSSGKGICFDYASLMVTMMRTQNIPTKLEIGYSGDIKHAWISAYVKEIGWVDDIIEFDGSSWTLMDPTLAASNNKKSVEKYVGDGTNYTLQYSY